MDLNSLFAVFFHTYNAIFFYIAWILVYKTNLQFTWITLLRVSTSEIVIKWYIYLLINFSNWSSLSHLHSGLVLFKIFWSVWRWHGNTYRNENFIFSVDFPDYLTNSCHHYRPSCFSLFRKCDLIDRDKDSLTKFRKYTLPK